MILITLRDLRWRARRIVLGVLATAAVLAMTLLLAAVHDSFLSETDRAIGFFGADAWVVPRGVAGPFTTNSPLPVDGAQQVRAQPGVRDVTAVAIFRHVVEGVSTDPAHPFTDVNVIAYAPGGVVVPRVERGRAPQRAGETAVDVTLGAPIGAELTLGGQRLRVVGVVRGLTYNGGTPTVAVTLEQGQRIAFGSRDLASAFVVRGVPRTLPAGLVAMSPRDVSDDLRRPLSVATRTVALLAVLLWLVATGIVAFICYLAGLDRLRDFAVYKALGVSTSRLAAGLLLEGVLVAVLAGGLAAVAALILVPAFPLPVELPVGRCLEMLAVSVGIGLVAGLASLRPVVTVDPALAFAGS
jgi:putative ABC transport system permease protein